MNIALMAHDRKKELMVQFCIAYCGILAEHSLCATHVTGKLVSEATGLPITLYLHADQGGAQQIGARISFKEIDLVLCPGLAFDPCGARLGWGKGYYDRYLVKTHAFPAGVCFAGCLLPRVPAQENDVPMRAVVCEEGIKRIGGNI